MDGKEWKNPMLVTYMAVRNEKKGYLGTCRVGSGYGICKGTFQIVTKIK